MNIVHISPNAPFNDGWGFQENLLPKYHALLGHKVTLIVPNKMHVADKIVDTETGTFYSCGGFDVIRMSYKKYRKNYMTNIFCKLDVYDSLLELKPDVVFYHGLVSQTIFDVIRYKKNIEKKGKKLRILQDNHLDYNIGKKADNFKQLLLRTYYRILNYFSQKSVDHVYGVTPWRKQYAEEYYHIKPEKTSVLIMGADDEKIDFANKEKIRNKIRRENNVADDDFLIVTGGKIDAKKKIHILMQACKDLKGVKLLIFGNVSNQLKEEYQRILRESKNIISVGWIDSGKVYDYFFAADLVCFPGQHSVLWEQACAAKVPCLFAKWPGMEHVNNGGNADFFENVTIDSIRKKIGELIFTKKYAEMKKIAESEATDVYLYSEIAKESLE